LGGIFTNTVRVSGQQLDQNPANNVATATTAVTPVTDLTISASGSPATVLLEQPLTYTVLVTNFGPNLATGVLLTDVLPGGFSFVSAVPSQGSCANVAGTVSC